MGFQVLPGELSDIPEVVPIHLAAFKDDPIMGQLMPNVTYQDQFDYFTGYYRKHFAEKHLTGSVFHKAIDTDTGKIVAYAIWRYAIRLTPEQRAEKEKLDTTRVYPKGTNERLYDDFFSKLDTLRKKHCDEEKDYLMHILIVDPAHQRKGLGSLLLREGLAAADHDNARCYIEASTKGLGLYKKLGWKECDEIIIDMRQYGGTSICSEKCLMREPGSGAVA
ncbi:MAG: hypothetical protein Q9179_004345 [Wetmoreana sp. 5 TL-2023]